MQRPRYEVRQYLSQNENDKFVLLYFVFDTLTLQRVAGWLRSEWDARQVIRQLEQRDRRVEEMKKNERVEIVKKIERLADDVFNLVCEEYCEFRHVKGEEKRFEEHCKDCKLKGYL